MDFESVKDELYGQLEQYEYAFSGLAVADMRRALVFGLCLAVNASRLRDEAAIARELSRPWPAGCTPTVYDDDELGEIANALLWIETAAPHKVGNVTAGKGKAA